MNCDFLDGMRGIDDNSVDAIITDPPYGILKHKFETDIDIDAFFKESHRVLKDNSFIVFFGQQPTLTTWNAKAFKLFKYKNEVIWYKRTTGTPMLDMQRVFENITICVKGNCRLKKVFRDYCDVKESLAEFVGFKSVIKDISQLKQLINDDIKKKEVRDSMLGNRKYIEQNVRKNVRNENVTISFGLKNEKTYIGHSRKILNGLQPQNLISFFPHNKQTRDMTGQGGGDNNIKHPTVKSIELMKYLIELTSEAGDVILDPFMGSGTTGIAARQLDRDFIGFEIDSEYYATASDRVTKAMDNFQEKMDL